MTKHSKRILATIFLLFSFFLCFAAHLTDTQGTASVRPIQNDDDTEYNVPIIMYHSVCSKQIGKFVVPPSVLENDLKYLSANGFVSVTITDLIRFQQSGTPLPEKPIMLTFDDGSLTNYTCAYPLLKKYNFKAVMSVVGEFVDSNYDCDGNLLPDRNCYLTYSQIKEMHDSGVVEIQNHTYSLHKIGARYGIKNKKNETLEQYKTVLTHDLEKLETRLTEKIGIRCTAVTFPYGVYTEKTLAVIKELGYKASLTCCEGTNQISRTSSLFKLKRFNRPFGKSSATYFERILQH